jgi:hypothetical protein
MDIESVESAISIMPFFDHAYTWCNDNKTLTIDFYKPLAHNTFYQVLISTIAKDLSGHNLKNDYEFGFITIEKSEDVEDILITLLFLIFAILLVIIIFGLIFVIKKRRTQDARSESKQAQSPPTQIFCPKCGYRFWVFDADGPIHIQCPNCGLSGKWK